MMTSAPRQSYRRVFTDGGALDIEFDETCPGRAFEHAQRACRGGEIKILADGCPLGRIRRASSGYWIIS